MEASSYHTRRKTSKHKEVDSSRDGDISIENTLIDVQPGNGSLIRDKTLVG